MGSKYKKYIDYIVTELLDDTVVSVEEQRVYTNFIKSPPIIFKILMKLDKISTDNMFANHIIDFYGIRNNSEEVNLVYREFKKRLIPLMKNNE
jgi:hypothetical protein